MSSVAATECSYLYSRPVQLGPCPSSSSCTCIAAETSAIEPLVPTNNIRTWSCKYEPSGCYSRMNQHPLQQQYKRQLLSRDKNNHHIPTTTTTIPTPTTTTTTATTTITITTTITTTTTTTTITTTNNTCIDIAIPHLLGSSKHCSASVAEPSWVQSRGSMWLIHDAEGWSLKQMASFSLCPLDIDRCTTSFKPNLVDEN